MAGPPPPRGPSSLPMSFGNDSPFPPMAMMPQAMAPNGTYVVARPAPLQPSSHMPMGRPMPAVRPMAAVPVHHPGYATMHATSSHHAMGPTVATAPVRQSPVRPPYATYGTVGGPPQAMPSARPMMTAPVMVPVAVPVPVPMPPPTPRPMVTNVVPTVRAPMQDPRRPISPRIAQGPMVASFAGAGGSFLVQQPPPQQRPHPAPSPAPSFASTQAALVPMTSQMSLSSSMESMHSKPSQQSHQSSLRGSNEQTLGTGYTPSPSRNSFSGASTTSDPNSLNASLPDLDELVQLRDLVFAGQDDRQRAKWCKDVLKYVERKLDVNRISDPTLIQLVDQAIQTINRAANAHPPLAEALYLRGDLLASGSFPSYHPKDLRAAFNDFELSARMGYAPSWFRIGRDYEMLSDMSRARDAYERGCSVQDVGCIYRIGMANLMGQLELAADHNRAIPLLKEAADLANLDTPQPSYVYGMLLSGEFDHVRVARPILLASADPQRTLEQEACRRIKRAAYLNFPPAQYRMGWLYEYAQLECAYDPLLSVQYYSLASQGGEVEADMALSKWFLCGAENCFDKNESLAFTFADKAAARGLPTAEFALGYYFEVGIGCEKDLDVANKWYKRAANHGNQDAQERIAALAGPVPTALSRKQHEAHIDSTLQRKRTEAKMLSDRRSQQGGTVPSSGGRTSLGGGAGPIVHKPTAPPPPQPSRDLRRKQTMRLVEEVANYGPVNHASGHRRGPSGGGMPMPLTNGTPRPAISGGPLGRLQGAPPLHQSARRGSFPTGSTPTPAAKPAVVPLARLASNDLAIVLPSKANIPVKSAASMGPDNKVYNTFDEMGFSAHSAKGDKDCVIC